MTIKWFGKKYPAPAYESCPCVETPVGAACIHCDEPIGASDDGWLYANGPAAHRECFMRAVLGSVAHQQRRCSCSGGDSADCEDGMTWRQSARAAVDYFETRGVKGE